jgi:PKD repeat protein
VTGHYWNFGDAASGISNTSSFNNAIHNFSAPGTYTVKLAIQYSDCGVDTIRQPVTILPSPTLSATNRTICPGATASLTATGAVSYTWGPGNFAGANYTVNPSISTTYTVTGTGNNSCTASKTATVTVKICTGIGEENQAANSPNLSPNPTPGQFELMGTVPGALIEIFSDDGKLLIHSECRSDSEYFSLDQFPDGVYILRYELNSHSLHLRVIKIN